MLDSLQIIKGKLNCKPSKLYILEDIHFFFRDTDNGVVLHAKYALK